MLVKTPNLIKVSVILAQVLRGHRFYVYWKRDRHFYVAIRATRRSSSLHRFSECCTGLGRPTHDLTLCSPAMPRSLILQDVK